MKQVHKCSQVNYPFNIVITYNITYAVITLIVLNYRVCFVCPQRVMPVFEECRITPDVVLLSRRDWSPLQYFQQYIYSALVKDSLN